MSLAVHPDPTAPISDATTGTAESIQE